MAWSSDFSKAPHDRQILIRTTGDKGRTFLTHWLQPNKWTPEGRFDGFPANAKTLLAWCEVPAFNPGAGAPLIVHKHIFLEDVGGDQ